MLEPKIPTFGVSAISGKVAMFIRAESISVTPAEAADMVNAIVTQIRLAELQLASQGAPKSL